MPSQSGSAANWFPDRPRDVRPVMPLSQAGSMVRRLPLTSSWVRVVRLRSDSGSESKARPFRFNDKAPSRRAVSIKSCRSGSRSISCLSCVIGADRGTLKALILRSVPDMAGSEAQRALPAAAMARLCYRPVTYSRIPHRRDSCWRGMADQAGILVSMPMAVRGPLVGRQAEFGRLRALLRDAAAGSPVVALVSGDAGVGKTRLVAELSAQARQDGFAVLTGRCAELADTVPYLPLADALRDAAAGPLASGPLAGALSARPVLSRLLPDAPGGQPPGAD